MRIGVAREVKPDEYRVALTPAGARELASHGHDVVVETNCGTFTITLDQAQSPNTTASFVALVEAGYFDRTIFPRIVPGFVIQGGDPTATGTGGPGYLTVDTPPRTAQYTHGVVAMAKTGAQPAGTSGSQFFIVTTANTGLTPDYAIIGTVTKGLDVVDRIGMLGGPDEVPSEVVEIVKATVVTPGRSRATRSTTRSRLACRYGTRASSQASPSRQAASCCPRNAERPMICASISPLNIARKICGAPV